MSDQVTRERIRSLQSEGSEAAARALALHAMRQRGESPDWDQERETDSDTLRLVIEGERFKVSNHYALGWPGMAQVDTEEGEEFILAESWEAASEAAQERWRDMATNDPEEFACMVGSETLIAWALGQSAGPGSAHATSLADWLENVVGQVPEEEFATYDGAELSVDRVGKLATELGFRPTLAYRTN